MSALQQIYQAIEDYDLRAGVQPDRVIIPPQLMWEAMLECPPSGFGELLYLFGVRVEYGPVLEARTRAIPGFIIDKE